MIISEVGILPESQAESFAWLRIKRFQNVSSSAATISRLHDLTSSQASNARKQAEQLRYCLIQAEEYWSAAKHVSLATKPLLMYYGIMSFALAEILLKQSGDSSLDRARAHHAHHGLTLTLARDPSRADSLKESAASLVARPMINNGQRQGTFELWHRSARELPIAGVETSFHASGSEERVAAVAGPLDDRLKPISSKGRSLLSLLVEIPGMQQVLAESRVISNLVRATFKSEIRIEEKTTQHSFMIHPTGDEKFQRVAEKVEISAGAFENVDVIPMRSGCGVKLNFSEDNPLGDINMPTGFQYNAGMTYLSSEEQLTEFGLIYCAMYILGNYARYYPDQWMRDVESATPLSLAAMTLIGIAEQRIPHLAMCEMSRVLYVTR